MFQESLRRIPLPRELPLPPEEEPGQAGGIDNVGGPGPRRGAEGAGGRNAPPPLPNAPPDLFNTPDAKPDAARPDADRGALRMPPPAAEVPGAVVEAPSSGPEPATNAATALADPSTLEIPADDQAATAPASNGNANAAPVAPPAAGPAMNPPTGPTAPPPPIMAPTARAPQRRGFLSRLFGDRNRRM
jgi:hypothetical protein